MDRDLIIFFGWFTFVIFGGSALAGLCAADASGWIVLLLSFALLASPTSLLFMKEI